MFNKNNFCHVASNNRNEQKAGLFVYKTTDNLDTVLASGYFNEKIVDINLHDLIIHEWHDPADRTKVQRNVLCVVERTLDNVGTSLIKSDWQEDIEQEIIDLANVYLKLDGTNTMTGPLKMRSSISFKCAIAPSWDGVGFYKLNDNDSLTLMASMETTDGLCPATNNTYNIGKASHKWKDAYIARVITAVINNGYDIAVPVTNQADTLALKSQVDLAANSGRMITDEGVWYAKMAAAGTIPAEAEVEGRNYADFTQVDGSGDPIIVIYTYTSGAWTLTETITPPAEYDGYVPVTSKIWDIPEQAGQQGGRILWNYQSKDFTPYPMIISFENIAVTGESTVAMPVNPVQGQIVNKQYVDDVANTLKYASNCITEIPQDIKLELASNGTLTLKAGSKVYVPNGAGVFNTVTTTSDLTVTRTDSNDCMVWYTPSGNNINIFPTQLFYSGPTAPTQYTFMYWYDTTNNQCKVTSNQGVTWSNAVSFPVCIVSTDGSKISAIKQVFNGFGYVGSTLFVLPGVKGLNPQGLKADGTLNNSTVTISSVMTRTLTTSATDEILTVVVDNSNLQAITLKVFEDTPDVSAAAWCYSIKQNRLGVYTPSDQSWIQTGKIIVGIVQKGSGGKVILINQKPVFHPVEYSDISTLLATIYPIGAIYISNRNTCPLKTLIPGSDWVIAATKIVVNNPNNVPVLGTGMTLGLTNGTKNVGLATRSGQGDGNQHFPNGNAYGITVTDAGISDSDTYGAFGVTTDPAKSGIIADMSSVATITTNVWIRVA